MPDVMPQQLRSRQRVQAAHALETAAIDRAIRVTDACFVVGRDGTIMVEAVGLLPDRRRKVLAAPDVSIQSVRGTNVRIWDALPLYARQMRSGLPINAGVLIDRKLPNLLIYSSAIERAFFAGLDHEDFPRRYLASTWAKKALVANREAMSRSNTVGDPALKYLRAKIREAAFCEELATRIDDKRGNGTFESLQSKDSWGGASPMALAARDAGAQAELADLGVNSLERIGLRGTIAAWEQRLMRLVTMPDTVIEDARLDVHLRSLGEMLDASVDEAYANRGVTTFGPAVEHFADKVHTGDEFVSLVPAAPKAPVAKRILRPGAQADFRL